MAPIDIGLSSQLLLVEAHVLEVVREVVDNPKLEADRLHEPDADLIAKSEVPERIDGPDRIVRHASKPPVLFRGDQLLLVDRAIDSLFASSLVNMLVLIGIGRL